MKLNFLIFAALAWFAPQAMAMRSTITIHTDTHPYYYNSYQAPAYYAPVYYYPYTYSSWPCNYYYNDPYYDYEPASLSKGIAIAGVLVLACALINAITSH